MKSLHILSTGSFEQTEIISYGLFDSRPAMKHQA